MNTISKPNIYEFQSLSSFLKAYIDFKKAINPRWTLGLWARRLGLSGNGSLSNILADRRVPSEETLEKMKTEMALSDYEKEYLDALTVNSLKNVDGILKKAAKKVLVENRKGKDYVEISDEVFRLISSPLALILQECIKLKGFQEDPTWIKERLMLFDTLAPESITKIFESLIEVGLIERKDGKLHPQKIHYKTPADVSSEALKDYYEASLAMNKKAVREIPREERHLNSVTLCCDVNKLTKLKETIHQFSRRLLDEFDQPEGEIVYQVHVQLIPHTKVQA